MSLLEFSGLSFGYNDEIIILEASGALHPGNVCGLVGINGGGKTTLLRILLGELNPDGGTVQRSRGTVFAHVAQAVDGDLSTPLYDYVQGGRPELLTLEHEIHAISDALSTAPEDEALIGRLGKAQERLDALGGHGWEHLVERLLLGLSFKPEAFTRPLAALSGGQVQKARLARQLLSDANCIILDEPTNHLDLEAQAFLVDWLRALTGRGGGAGLPAARGDCGVLLVSHDRWFLDALCSAVWELEAGVLYRYPGNYSKYLPQREARRKLAAEQYAAQREEIARTEEYIRRNIAGQNTKQARGRRTLLGRMERLEAPASDPQIGFLLKPSLRTGEQVLIVEDLSFAYNSKSESPKVRESESPEDEDGALGLSDARTVGLMTEGKLDLNPRLDYVRAPGAQSVGRSAITDLSFQVMRQERLGIVGPNGCGKTTLLKLLTRALAPRHGLIAWGSNVELGIFSQDSADLTAGHNLMAELREADPLMTDGQVRDYLARFGFSGDDVMKDVGGLSGGERSRLSLGKLFRRRPNVLLLDEPTNHLDIYAREALEQFLDSYEGTLVMVTHDRALLERICDRLLVFERVTPVAGLDPGRSVGVGQRPHPRGSIAPPDAEAGADTAAPLPEVPVFEPHYFRGHYSEYLKWKSGAGAAEAAGNSVTISVPTAEGKNTDPKSALPAIQTRPGLPSPEQLAVLARQERCSPSAYCKKQIAKAEKRGMELETQIEAGEEAINAFEQQQRDADGRGEYTKIAVLQEQIDAHRAKLDAMYLELEGNMTQIEAWAELEFVTG